MMTLILLTVIATTEPAPAEPVPTEPANAPKAGTETETQSGGGVTAVEGATVVEGAPLRAEKSAPPPGKTRLAVADVQVAGAGLEPVVGASLSAVLAAEILARGGDRYEVMSRGDLRSIVKQQIDQQQLGCTDSDCLQDLQKLAAVDWLVTASVAKLGDDWVLSLELVDLRAGMVTARQKASWKGNPAGLVELIRPYVARLLDGTAAEEYRGTLEILTSEKDAEVVVNNRKLGAAPVAPVADLPIGKHAVTVNKPGFLPYQTDVVVHRNETTVLQANLIDEASLEPWWQKWWVWAGAGAAVLAVTAVGIGVGLGGEDPPQPPELVIGHSLPQ